MASAKTNDPTTTAREEVAPGEERLRPGDLTTGGCFVGRRAAIDVGQDQKCVGDPVHERAVANKARPKLKNPRVRAARVLQKSTKKRAGLAK